MKRLIRFGSAGLLFAAVLAGCATDDAAKRVQSRDEVVERRRRETAEFFATNTAPLTLDQAFGVKIGWVSVREAVSTESPRVSEWPRRTGSETRFLSVAAYMYFASRRGRKAENAMPFLMFASDASKLACVRWSVRSRARPTAWLMFFEARHLEQAQKYRLERARQLLDVQVTAQFYESAVADALIRSYESETNATAALERRVADLVAEGYATKPDLARVRTKAKNDRYELKKATDRAELARARLADILRFMPGEPALKADGASMMAVLDHPREITLEDALMESLTNRLDLFAADRITKVREIEIYRALTEWLPEIAVAGGGNYANQELLETSQFWSGGLVGAMSLFKGFQSVNDYRKAKEERKAKYELLENRMMAVVVSVIDAYRNRERAEEGAAVARAAVESAQMDYDSAKDRFDEGRETFSHLMDKITALEKAKVRASSAEYARALTEIVFRNAIGENLK